MAIQIGIGKMYLIPIKSHLLCQNILEHEINKRANIRWGTKAMGIISKAISATY